MNMRSNIFNAAMPHCQLGEVLEFRNEIIHPKDRPSGTATFVGLEHIERDTGIRIGSDQINLSEMTGRRSRFKSGDIVYGYLRPYLNKVWLAEFDGLCSVDQYVFKTKRNADCNYVAHFLRSSIFLKTAPIDSTPGQLPRIRSGEIVGTLIPLPPLDEQRRIAAILDKADALRRKRQRALDLLDGLKQVVFYDLFGDPSLNPKGLRKGIIGDLLESTQYGTSSKAGSVGTYPILRMGNIGPTGRISTDDLKYVTLEDTDISRYTLQKGDILFNRTNSVELVGKTAVFDLDETYAFAGYLVRARARSDVSPKYISGYLNSMHGKKILRGMAKSIVGMANINAREMQSIPMLIPSEAEQMRYQRRVEAIDHGIGEQGKSLVEIDALFASLQHRAFTGQL